MKEETMKEETMKEETMKEDRNMKEDRVYINGETAIKPYFYLRNNLLHVRYTVDRCIKLSEHEAKHVKDGITQKPYDKQGILFHFWEFFTKMVEKPIINDGIQEADRIVARKNNER